MPFGVVAEINIQTLQNASLQNTKGKCEKVYTAKLSQ
jgi:hypothetical protein